MKTKKARGRFDHEIARCLRCMCGRRWADDCVQCKRVGNQVMQDAAEYRVKWEDAEADASRKGAALKRVLEVLMLSDPEGNRAKGITAPEDPQILDLCQRIGFGAVMDSAARQWRTKTGLGHIAAHTTGACVGTLRDTVKLVRSALRKRRAS